MIKHFVSAFISRIAAVIIATVFFCSLTPVRAQTDPDTVIAPPPALPPIPAQREQTFQGTADTIASSFSDSLQSLRANLGVLHDLNSRENQAAIDALGKNYGNIPSLGTDLANAINSIDTVKIRDSSEELEKNVSQSLGNADKIMKTQIEQSHERQQAIASQIEKETGYSLQNPPDAAHLPMVQTEAERLAKQASADISGPSIQLVTETMDIAQLNNNIRLLNSNVASVTQTYLNLIKLTTENPSMLVGMSDLNTSLATVDNVAMNPLKNLSGLAGSFIKINQGYELERKSNSDPSASKQAQALDAARDAINAPTKSLTEGLASINDEMAQRLGSPAVPVTVPNTVPSGPAGAMENNQIPTESTSISSPETTQPGADDNTGSGR